MKILKLSAALATCLLALPACSDDDPGLDSSVRLDGHIHRDARVDARPGVDASLTCGAQDLLDQFLCGTGRKCTLTNGTTTVGCAEAGGTPEYSTCTPDYPDDCEVGSLCSEAAGSYQCLPFCEQPGTYCYGGRCGDTAVASDGTVSVYLCEPTDTCDPVTTEPTSSLCDTGEACYLASVGDGMTFCQPEGTALEGADCLDDFACEQGYTCFGPPGDGICRKVCHTGNDADCAGSGTCGELSTAYGVCIGY